MLHKLIGARSFKAVLQTTIGVAIIIVASSIFPARAQVVIYQENFNTDGEGTRYTSHGRGFVLDSGAGGSAYWAPSSQVISSGGEVSIAIKAPARRAALAWHHLLPVDEIKPDMATLLKATIDWLTAGRTGKIVIFSPSLPPDNTGDVYIADLLTAKGFTVQDDDTTQNPPDPAGIALVVQSSSGVPNAIRFLRYAAPLLSYNGPNHDDEGTSSIGEAGVQTDAMNPKIVTAAHPAAGGLSGAIQFLGSPQPLDSLGLRLPNEATVIASYQRLVPFTLTSLAKAERLISGELASTKTTGLLDFADLKEDDASAGVWTRDLTPPGINGNTPDAYVFQGKGKIAVSTVGTYTFALSADAGARLRIDLNKNGLGPDDDLIIIDGTGAIRTVTKDVEFTSTGTYDFEWVAYDEGGTSGSEVSVASVAGAPAPSVDDLTNWELLGDHAAASKVKLVGQIDATTYVPTVTDALTDYTLLAVVDTGQRLLGDPLSGWEGSGFWAGADMNEPTITPEGCCIDITEPRTLTLNPVNVTGKTNVKLTIALAAADIDFETPDYLSILVDPDGDAGLSDFVALEKFAAPPDGSAKYFLDKNGSGAQKLGYVFRDFTFNVPANATQLVVKIEAMSTFYNEMLGFDNIRITAAGTAPPPASPLSIKLVGNKVEVTFTGGVLASATSLPGSWVDVAQTSPYIVTLGAQAGAQFFRTHTP